VGVVPVVGVGGCGVGKVLVEGASGVESHVLHAEADAEGWVGGVVEGLEQGKFKGLAVGMDGLGLRMGGDAPLFGEGVVAAGEDEGGAAGEVGGDVIRVGIEEEGRASGGGDGGRVVGDADAAVEMFDGADVGGDADGWLGRCTVGHGSSIIGVEFGDGVGVLGVVFRVVGVA